MYEDFMDADKEIYYDGMMNYLRIVENLLMDADLLEDEKEAVIRILDMAQGMFEKEIDY